jgi:hypothetical protein
MFTMEFRNVDTFMTFTIINGPECSTNLSVHVGLLDLFLVLFNDAFSLTQKT